MVMCSNSLPSEQFFLDSFTCSRIQSGGFSLRYYTTTLQLLPVSVIDSASSPFLFLFIASRWQSLILLYIFQWFSLSYCIRNRLINAVTSASSLIKNVIHPELGRTWCGSALPSLTNSLRILIGNGRSANLPPCIWPISLPFTRNSVPPKRWGCEVTPGQLINSVLTLLNTSTSSILPLSDAVICLSLSVQSIKHGSNFLLTWLFSPNSIVRNENQSSLTIVLRIALIIILTSQWSKVKSFSICSK